MRAVPQAVPAFFFLFFLTFSGFTTSSCSNSSELITLNLWEAGWPPLPGSGAAWSPEPLSVELRELLLLRGSLATELATEEPLSLVSETVAPDGFSARCPDTCSAHPDVSRLSRAGKGGVGFTTGYKKVDVLSFRSANPAEHQPAEVGETNETKRIARKIPTNGSGLQEAHVPKSGKGFPTAAFCK